MEIIYINISCLEDETRNIFGTVGKIFRTLDVASWLILSFMYLYRLVMNESVFRMSRRVVTTRHCPKNKIQARHNSKVHYKTNSN